MPFVCSGKQHDVAECMDNCIFQIETALLKFDGMTESQGGSSDKTSVVKRYASAIFFNSPPISRVLGGCFMAGFANA